MDLSEPISKQEFAARRGVTPARVSQWLAEGKITGEAIVGSGRHARIREDVACLQLERRLDAGQRDGNGRLTSFAVAMPLDAATSMEVGRIIARVVDGVLPELAAAVAEEFRHPQREVLGRLRVAWREIAMAKQAEAGIRLTPGLRLSND